MKGRVERLLEGDLSPAWHSSSPISFAKYSLLGRSHPWEVEVFLMVISICFSLMTKDSEHFSTHILDICMSFLNESLVEVFAHFELGYWSSRFRTSLYILDINPLPHM